MTKKKAEKNSSSTFVTLEMKRPMHQAIKFIIDRLIAGDRNLDLLKRQASKQYGVDVIKNPLILEHFPKSKLTAEFKALLLKKPAKTMSGVTPVAVMIKPDDSCNQKCIYCPFTGLAAKSYVGFEPAALRGRQYNFDPYRQTKSRVEQLESAGHNTDKCEIIVMGGTFLRMPIIYKKSFIKGIYDALNKKKSKSLELAIKTNQTTKRRAIGLTIETRPDVCIKYIDEMLSYGATRVELGIQHADDKIYELIQRGHQVKDVFDATRELKNSAFKVLYHVMPGLPGSNKKKDIAFVKKLFADDAFRPDMLKIYPTLVIEGTGLHKMMLDGKYEPYSSEHAADVISDFYKYIPKYVRVMRIQRDIPAQKIDAGVKKSNLRELVEQKIREKGIIPNEIRYREIKSKCCDLSDFELRRLDYGASGGKEIFLSYENDDDLIAGFLRLRFPDKSNRKQIDGHSALVRELHIYGPEIQLKGMGKVQHMGFGSKLLKLAEEIAKDAGKDRILVISGVGVREYYKKHGYVLEGPYMCKTLD